MSTMTLEELRDELENGCLEYIDRQDAVIAIDCAISQLAEIHDALYQSNQKNDALLRERESAKAAVTYEMKVAAMAAWNATGGGTFIHGLSDLANMGAALEAVAPMLASARVPDGWQLAPIEPTESMLNACNTVIQGYGAKLVWGRMLAAAPKPETEE